jgi:hypothetical protein
MLLMAYNVYMTIRQGVRAAEAAGTPATAAA